MSARVHQAAAELCLEAADSDVSANFELKTGEQKSDVLLTALVHATLALAEQQRLANVIALARLEAEGGGTEREAHAAVFDSQLQRDVPADRRDPRRAGSLVSTRSRRQNRQKTFGWRAQMCSPLWHNERVALVKARRARARDRALARRGMTLWEATVDRAAEAFDEMTMQVMEACREMGAVANAYTRNPR